MENFPMSASALYYTAPGQAEIRDAPMGAGDLTIRAVASAISRGTERLVFEGRVPESEWNAMRAPMQEGDFPFPVKYGYQCVGVVEDGDPSLIGQTVFVLHPHQTRFRAPSGACIPVPAHIPPARATLAANMETALNAVWDAGLAPGDRVAVIGAGALGCLIARLAARTPGVDVVLIDKIEGRAAIANELSVTFAEPAGAPRDCDLVFHASATEAGLKIALEAAGTEGKIIESSWYGDRPVTIPLGAAFHSRRLSIVSTQVGTIPPARAPRWTHRRRLAKAVELLDDPALDTLITAEVAFADLPTRLPQILGPNAEGVATVIRYGSP
jgi:threonine dehydrogenase-like Zn-dependent dehydrogenase